MKNRIYCVLFVLFFVFNAGCVVIPHRSEDNSQKNHYGDKYDIKDSTIHTEKVIHSE